jgi:cytoskeletal protein CcmA (bactofilin family)
MFGKKNSNHAGRNTPLLTIMGESARVEGKFNIADSIQIECEVAGEIHVDGKLVIGEHGIVRADVHTVDALIMGRYEGNMVATGNVEITATGRVAGNIETDSLMISKGGFFNGNVIKSQRSEQAPERRSPAPSLLDQKQATKRPA